MIKRMPSILGLAALALALPASSVQAGSYVFTNFSLGGPQGAGGTTINGINNNGAVVGFGQDSTQSVFTNFAGVPGTPTILNIDNSTTAMANGINDSNQVVGSVNGAAFLLYNNYHNLFTLNLPAGASSEAAFGINNAGLIVGQYGAANGTTPGFIYNDGSYTTLNPVAPVGGVLVVNAQGINNNGIVAGFYSTDDTTTPIDGNEPQHGFLYNMNTGHYTLVADPTVPSGDTFFTVQLLGINDKGIVSGYVQDTNGDQFGLLYNINTNTYTYLNDPDAALINGVQMTQITGINNSGEITGFYINSSGFAEGFVATPSAVPEPASLALLGVGLAGVACAGYIRRRLRMKAASA
jgi:hypothetical protein